MAKIFISYSRESRAVVEDVVKDLDTGDWEIWFDERLGGGQPWWDEILRQIRECGIFVAALTPESLASEACRGELKYAFDLQKPLLPVRLSDKVQPKFLPLGLGERQIVDYIRQDREDARKLRLAIRNLPKAPPLPDPLPGPPAVPGSYRTLIEQIQTESRLDQDDQVLLVAKLRHRLLDGSPGGEINELLQLLLKRHDLLHGVVREIQELQGKIDKLPGGIAGSTGDNVIEPKNDRNDHVPATQHFTLDSPGVVTQCKGLLERVVERRECWVFDIVADNNFVIELDASAEKPTIIAKATLIGGARERELKALGWTVDSSDKWVARAIGGAALYFTGGLAAGALASRDVRNWMTGFEAHRSWIVSSSKDALVDVAVDFMLAIRRVAPEAKSILVKREEAEPQP